MLPIFNGVDVAAAMRRAGLNTQTLIYTMHDTAEVISRALEAGARGFVLKSDPGDSLFEALEAISEGRRHLSPTALDTLLEGVPEGAPSAPLSCLTLRERQMIQLVAEGWTNKRISLHLKISTKTIETHRSHAMRKLNIASIPDLVRWAIKNQVIQS